jgi:hypothetical protein
VHLWNEHLPPYTDRGPDLAWASNMRRRPMSRSSCRRNEVALLQRCAARVSWKGRTYRLGREA